MSMELRFSIRCSNIGGGADELLLECEAPKPPKMETCIICDGGLDLNNLHHSHVEYFGLMNKEEYAKKAELKRQMAKAGGIDLVEILPNTDWESLLQRIVQGRE